MIYREIEFLDGPERRQTFPAEELLLILPIHKTATVLDLIAGMGYLTIPAAQMVDGMVYALDTKFSNGSVISEKYMLWNSGSGNRICKKENRPLSAQ
jgi:hypothetical protein